MSLPDSFRWAHCGNTRQDAPPFSLLPPSFRFAPFRWKQWKHSFRYDLIGKYVPCCGLVRSKGEIISTPTFLVKRLKALDFDVRRFSSKTLYASASMLKDYSEDNPDPIPLLYQTGYLTIVDYDPAGREYTLAFPNNEVKYGFLECLIPEYVNDCGSGGGIYNSRLLANQKLPCSTRAFALL